MNSNRIVLLCLLLTVSASSLAAQGVPDFLLYGFHGAKLGLAFLAAGTAITDPEAAAAPPYP